jgi:excinuclease UvrABC ATPase subunit
LLDRLVDSGKSVIVIEHHRAVMAHADWIIDLGPGAGHDGGRIVFEGTPADLAAAKSTLTGEHLAAFWVDVRRLPDLAERVSRSLHLASLSHAS